MLLQELELFYSVSDKSRTKCLHASGDGNLESHRKQDTKKGREKIRLNTDKFVHKFAVPLYSGEQIGFGLGS